MPFPGNRLIINGCLDATETSVAAQDGNKPSIAAEEEASTSEQPVFLLPQKGPSTFSTTTTTTPPGSSPPLDLLRLLSSTETSGDLVQSDDNIAPAAAVASLPGTTSYFYPNTTREWTLLSAGGECVASVDVDHKYLCWPAWPIYSSLFQHSLMQGTNGVDCGAEGKSPAEYMSSQPESLKPTPLQLAVPHRRWIDRFPFPRLRDNLILLSGLIDLDEFVHDLFTTASLVWLGPQRQGQGATWDPESWTLGRSEFAPKWAYLFQ